MMEERFDVLIEVTNGKMESSLATKYFTKLISQRKMNRKKPPPKPEPKKPEPEPAITIAEPEKEEILINPFAPAAPEAVKKAEDEHILYKLTETMNGDFVKTVNWKEFLYRMKRMSRKAEKVIIIPKNQNRFPFPLRSNPKHLPNSPSTPSFD